jgi:transcriptional regulator with XRE-family HTH domain
MTTPDGFPVLLRRFRSWRRLTQEQLAEDATLSTRHLSFLETGKSNPSRDMVLRLARTLDLELRDRNALLSSAGFAPVFGAQSLDSLALAPVRQAIDLMFDKLEPYGAVLLDRSWNVLELNQGAVRMLQHFAPASCDPSLLTNIVRAILHPGGLRAAIVDWETLVPIVVDRLEREVAVAPDGDPRRALLHEAMAYPDVAAASRLPLTTAAPVALVHLKNGPDEVRLFTMVTTLGTPLDVTAQELAIEAYFPADAPSAAVLARLAQNKQNAEV